jgi:hypothetical protein
MIIGVTLLGTEFLSVGTVTGGPSGTGELIGRCSATASGWCRAWVGQRIGRSGVT